MRETRTRSIAKVLSWRTVGTLDTIAISFLLTGSITISLGIGGIEVFTKIVLYYFHERAWNFVSWGKTT
ncbi:MAG: DUF2061 domain-containing protein [Parcubacteria group bacterium]|nr:DUF2061 domain-containing protein [Parcubacteria group bacterium]